MVWRNSLAAGAAIAVVANAALAAAPTLPAWSPSPAAAVQLSHGQAWAEVLAAPDGAGLIHAAIDIAAPPGAVWRVMTNCAFARQLVTTVTSCRILRADPGGAWDVREQVTRGSLMVPQIHNIFRSDYEPFARIRFRMVGGDLKAEDGEWRLEPLNGGAGTRVIYINHIAADILAPAALVREGMRRDTPKVLINLRRVCLAGR